MKRFLATWVMASAVTLSTFAQHPSGVDWTTTDWMKYLPDDALVCQLSLPGTHDTATDEGWAGVIGGLFGGTLSKTQDKKVSEQYNLGVRAFDIRPYPWLGTVYNSHGLTRLKLKMEDMFDAMITFLDQHPTEFFVFHVYKGGNSWEADDFADLINKDKYKGRIASFRASLTVGEMRGKMLFLCRHDHNTTTWPGGFLRNWSETGFVASQDGYINANGTDDYAWNEGSAKLYIQDESSPNVNDDANAVETEMADMCKLLDFTTTHVATTHDDALIWTYNFCSGCALNETEGSDGYRYNATFTNTRMLNYLTAADYTPGPTGIILMDYACVSTVTFDSSSNANLNGNAVHGDELVDALIDNNFRCRRSQLILQIWGDVNLSGKVDVADVATLIDVILGTHKGDVGVTDLNSDGQVNEDDVTELVKLLM